MKARRDRRRLGALLTLALVLVGGLWLDQRSVDPGDAASAVSPPRMPHQAEVTQRFNQAVAMLHAKQYDYAIAALHRVLLLAPELPEAHVNMGFALLGLNRSQEAQAFFEAAVALRPEQANAYYGLAMAWEATGDRALALGAMRTYVHLARQEDPEHLSRARSALWEWQAEANAKR